VKIVEIFNSPHLTPNWNILLKDCLPHLFWFTIEQINRKIMWLPLVIKISVPKCNSSCNNTYYNKVRESLLKENIIKG